MLPLLIVRADAAPRMGTGHVMRCIALATAAQTAGMDVRGCSRVGVAWLRERLQSQPFPWHEVPGEPPEHETPLDLLAQIAVTVGEAGHAACRGGGGAAVDPIWVVLDGYHFGTDCQQALRAAGYQVLVIDDCAHLSEYAADLLLNQNIGAESLPYTGAIEQTLFGPGYALLRPEFAVARTRAVPREFPRSAQQLLLTLGGGDMTPALSAIAPLFAQPELAGCALHVLPGGIAPQTIQAAFSCAPCSLHMHPHVSDMPAMMLKADLCIAAGGSTCWELCCLGTPFLTVEVADNQHRTVRGLAAGDVAPELNAATLSAMLHSAQARTASSQAGLRLVDGHGAHKVVAAMRGMAWLLRPAEPRDARWIWDLATSPDVRAVSGSTAAFSWDTHSRWYARKLQDVHTQFYAVSTLQGAPCGYVRFEQADDTATLSIALHAQIRGRGWSPLILREACRIFWRSVPHCPVQALVLPDNAPSRKAFHKAGFTACGEATCGTRQAICFVLQPE